MESAMADEYATVQERYARATQASNLADDAHHHQLDIIKAVALAGGLGGLLIRVKIGLDATSYPQLVGQWKLHITRMADTKHWPTCIKPEKVAVEVLRYWLNNVCAECTGVKFVRHEKSPSLKAEICPCCDGTGSQPPKFANEYRRYALDAMAELEEIDLAVGINASMRLKRRE
jgi:hypothetical protein